MHHLAGDVPGINSNSQFTKADGHASHARILQTSEDTVQCVVGWWSSITNMMTVGKATLKTAKFVWPGEAERLVGTGVQCGTISDPNSDISRLRKVLTIQRITMWAPNLIVTIVCLNLAEPVGTARQVPSCQPLDSGS